MITKAVKTNGYKGCEFKQRHQMITKAVNWSKDNKWLQRLWIRAKTTNDYHKEHKLEQRQKLITYFRTDLE